MVAGGGFIPIITSNVLNYIKKIEFKKKNNQFYPYKKQLKQFLKMGSIPFWVQFHADLKIGTGTSCKGQLANKIAQTGFRGRGSFLLEPE